MDKPDHSARLTQPQDRPMNVNRPEAEIQAQTITAMNVLELAIKDYEAEHGMLDGPSWSIALARVSGRYTAQYAQSLERMLYVQGISFTIGWEERKNGEV